MCVFECVTVVFWHICQPFVYEHTQHVYLLSLWKEVLCKTCKVQVTLSHGNKTNLCKLPCWHFFSPHIAHIAKILSTIFTIRHFHQITVAPLECRGTWKKWVPLKLVQNPLTLASMLNHHKSYAWLFLTKFFKRNFQYIWFFFSQYLFLIYSLVMKRAVWHHTPLTTAEQTWNMFCFFPQSCWF